MAGIVNRFTVGAAAISAAMGAVIAIGKDFAAAFIESERAAVKLDAVLKATGGAAGLSAKSITDFSTAMQHATGVSDEAVTNVQTLLLTFREIGGDLFPRATEAALDLSAVFGQDLQSSAVQLGKALQDPIAGVTALRRVGVQLNDQQEAQIKTFVAMGDIVSAQNVILRELEMQVGGTATALGETIGGKLDRLNQGFGDLKEVMGEAIAEGFEPLLDATLQWIESEDARVFAQNFAADITTLATAMQGLADRIGDVNEGLNQVPGSGGNFIGNLFRPLADLDDRVQGVWGLLNWSRAGSDLSGNRRFSTSPGSVRAIAPDLPDASELGEPGLWTSDPFGINKTPIDAFGRKTGTDKTSVNGRWGGGSFGLDAVTGGVASGIERDAEMWRVTQERHMQMAQKAFDELAFSTERLRESQDKFADAIEARVNAMQSGGAGAFWNARFAQLGQQAGAEFGGFASAPDIDFAA